MYEFLTEHSIYVVLIIVLLIWSGLFYYLVRLDQKLTRLEKSLSETEPVSPAKPKA
jgi:CcmD family protein